MIISKRMKDRVFTSNSLQKLVQRKNLLNMSNFVELSDSLDIGFPRLSIEEIEHFITFGNYQIEQSKGYLREHFNNNHGGLKILVANNIINPPLIIVCIRFHSRHKSQIEYKSYG